MPVSVAWTDPCFPASEPGAVGMALTCSWKRKGSRAYRRNILALASVFVVAGLAGADPHDLSVFGVKPDEDWGVDRYRCGSNADPALLVRLAIPSHEGRCSD